MTTIKLDRYGATLTLQHTTVDNYVGVLVMPTDPFQNFALEVVTSPQGVVIHEATFPPDHIASADDLTPYLIGMTNTARRQFRMVS